MRCWLGVVLMSIIQKFTAGLIFTGPSTAGAALSIFTSPHIVTAKRHIDFWENPQQREEVAAPGFINTDKASTYGLALTQLKREGRRPYEVEHRQIKYRNNVIECDHG